MKRSLAIAGYAAAEISIIAAMGAAAVTALIILGRSIEWGACWLHVRKDEK